MIGSSIESTCTYNLHVHDSEFFVCEGPERIPRNDYICLRGRFRRRGGEVRGIFSILLIKKLTYFNFPRTAATLPL